MFSCLSCCCCKELSFILFFLPFYDFLPGSHRIEVTTFDFKMLPEVNSFKNLDQTAACKTQPHGRSHSGLLSKHPIYSDVIAAAEACSGKAQNDQNSVGIMSWSGKGNP